MFRHFAIAFVLLTLPLQAAEPLKDLDAHVNKALKAHGVPGMGIAVVQDGKVMLAKGFGVKTLGGEPVAAESLFAIGSVSKSFTVAAIAMLVDDKKLKWDDPIRKHLPNFKMPDRWLHDEITVRDVLCHRVGLERNELVWYGSPLTRLEIIDKLPLLKLDKKIRTTFTYNNILYMAAGEAAAKAAGKSWDDLVGERIFSPLGMTTANTSVTKFVPGGDTATPHEKRDGKTIAVKWKNIDNIGPAGSINASAKDMAEYVRFQLAKGKAGDKRLIEKDTFAAMHEPTVVLPKGAFELNPEAKWRSYGLGWMVSEFRGHKYVEHGGNIDGMTASVMLLPEKKIGVVCLANLGGSILPTALGMDILDMVLGNEPQNLAESTRLLTFVSDYGMQKALEPDETKHVKDTKPTFELKKYAGKYTDKVLAPVEVKLENDKLVVTFNGITLDATHWHYDTFIAKDRDNNFPRILFTFEQSDDGGVSAVKFKPLLDEEFRFKKAK